MEVLSMFERPRSVALEYEKPGTYGTGLIPPTRSSDRVWLRGLRDNHPYLGLVVFMGTHNTSIQDQNDLLSNGAVAGDRTRVTRVTGRLSYGPLYIVVKL
ncbi:hypothetical protein PIB30_056992 [Stylosanthes scabra]|uniref:Uncharacterized protein n=1 Tax=Stylosanthes scabra TaxID=79078 RepID=A0ABU6UIW6_9FABA|nr:hypothetical protein [Stylosanthes scabra]